METEKLYYNDGKLSAFTATVLECREAKDGWDVVLDRTAFYPEGGGQPCDRGTLERLEVLDVQEQKNCILHRLEQPLLPGTEVRGQVDLARRFDYVSVYLFLFQDQRIQFVLYLSLCFPLAQSYLVS